MDLRKLDKRIVDRNLVKGIVTPKDYQKYLSELKNLEAEYDVFEVQPPEQKNARGNEAAVQPAASVASADEIGGENKGS